MAPSGDGTAPGATSALFGMAVSSSVRVAWLSWHVFRHTHATLGEQIGMSLSDRQAQMGHGDVRMTMHYTHSDIERRRTSIEAIAGRLTEARVDGLAVN